MADGLFSILPRLWICSSIYTCLTVCSLIHPYITVFFNIYSIIMPRLWICSSIYQCIFSCSSFFSWLTVCSFNIPRLILCSSFFIVDRLFPYFTKDLGIFLFCLMSDCTFFSVPMANCVLLYPPQVDKDFLFFLPLFCPGCGCVIYFPISDLAFLHSPQSDDVFLYIPMADNAFLYPPQADNVLLYLPTDGNCSGAIPCSLSSPPLSQCKASEL